MNYEDLKQKHDPARVAAFTRYVASLQRHEDTRAWAGKAKEEQYARLFDEVASKGAYIDGDTITLKWRGGKKSGIEITFDYRAYKNLVLNNYPDSVFDVGLVYEGDTFKFEKENGSVLYNHQMNDEFNPNRKIVGAYCIIKNRRGEFINTITASDAAKMKKTAKTKTIWETWEDQMWFKSVVKRACKFHFQDLVGSIDNLDNDLNYELPKREKPAESDKKSARRNLVKLLKELHEFDADKAEDFRMDLLAKEESKELTMDFIKYQTEEVEAILQALSKRA